MLSFVDNAALGGHNLFGGMPHCGNDIDEVRLGKIVIWTYDHSFCYEIVCVYT
jgi:hypothetical protein